MVSCLRWKPLPQLQAEVSSNYRGLIRIFEKHGLPQTPGDMLSVESTEAILNGTGFTLAGCDLFKFFFYRGWSGMSEASRGFYYCSRESVLSVHIAWYFSKVSLPNEFIREFNRR